MLTIGIYAGLIAGVVIFFFGLMYNNASVFQIKYYLHIIKITLIGRYHDKIDKNKRARIKLINRLTWGVIIVGLIVLISSFIEYVEYVNCDLCF